MELEEMIRTFQPVTDMMKEQWQHMGIPPMYGHLIYQKEKSTTRQREEVRIHKKQEHVNVMFTDSSKIQEYKKKQTKKKSSSKLV